MIHKFGYKDLVHNDNQTNDCPICKPEQAIARVRELHKQIVNECWSCLDENGLGIKYPCDTIKALEGEQ